MLYIFLFFGFFSLAAIYYYFMDFRHLLNRRTARKDLAVTAMELGLKKTGSGGLGTFQGRIEGYFINITPEEYTKITIMLKTRFDVWLFRTNRLEKMINGKSMKEPFPNSVPFVFGNNDSNRFFHYRFASEGVAEALGRANALLSFFGALARKWRWSMGPMQLIYGQITASPSRGLGHKCHSITGRQLKEFLPDLIALANLWDSLPDLIEESRSLGNDTK